MIKPITHQINEEAIRIIKRHKNGVRRVDLIHALQKKNPDWHSKTINGCVWLLVEKFPEEVCRTEDKHFQAVT